MINQQLVEDVLNTVPADAQCCYTGQSILAYCPDPTFTWDEINVWEQETDLDLFCYNTQSQAAIVQAFMSDGWVPPTPIEEFKANRIRFAEPTSRFNLQTVHLEKEGYPELNISWRRNCEDAVDVIKVFDMDYLCVSMDVSTGAFADLRGSNHRIAHVNKLNARFNPVDAEPSYWYRQFERCPKGWSRGIDTRPVAEQYIKWIDCSISMGDKTVYSKTRQYADKFKQEALAPFIEAGMDEDEASLIYDLIKQEKPSWESLCIKHKAHRDKIQMWLDSVSD